MDDGDLRRLREVVDAEPNSLVKRRYTFGLSNLTSSYNREYLMLMPKYRDRLYGVHVVEKMRGKAGRIEFSVGNRPGQGDGAAEFRGAEPLPFGVIGAERTGAGPIYTNAIESKRRRRWWWENTIHGGQERIISITGITRQQSLRSDGLTGDTPARPRAPPPPQAADEPDAAAGVIGEAGALFLDWAAATLDDTQALDASSSGEGGREIDLTVAGDVSDEGSAVMPEYRLDDPLSQSSTESPEKDPCRRGCCALLPGREWLKRERVN
ncbi:hypothetical protein FOZ60_008074 [Perkinsus olseni]|uniref:Uncharacterized protein n=1 Tax=Perkinsus olseni TaxID=32597 RepID=A0A7J6PFG5_PEROL|nr:hypothetical protein FOZ60_008074 [Perkinsus olseni]